MDDVTLEAIDAMFAARVAVERTRAIAWLAAAAVLLALAVATGVFLTPPKDVVAVALAAPLSGAVTFALRQYVVQRDAERTTWNTQAVIRLIVVTSTTANAENVDMLVRGVLAALGELPLRQDLPNFGTG